MTDISKFKNRQEMVELIKHIFSEQSLKDDIEMTGFDQYESEQSVSLDEEFETIYKGEQVIVNIEYDINFSYYYHPGSYHEPPDSEITPQSLFIAYAQVNDENGDFEGHDLDLVFSMDEIDKFKTQA